jgi:hypothetical protein
MCIRDSERTVVAIVKAIETNYLDQDFLLNWITQLGSYKKPTQYPEAYYLKNNVRNLLRSLYFAFHNQPQYEPLRTHIETILTTKVQLR